MGNNGIPCERPTRYTPTSQPHQSDETRSKAELRKIESEIKAALKALPPKGSLEYQAHLGLQSNIFSIDFKALHSLIGGKIPAKDGK